MDCFNYRIAEEPIFRVSVPTKRGAPLASHAMNTVHSPYFYIPHNYHFGITRKQREDKEGFLRTVGEQPQTAGAADGVRIADGSSPTRDQIVNESIRQYFMRV